MTRRRKTAVAIVALVVLAATAAGAALLFKLHGTGSSTGLNNSLVWASADGTNDDGTGTGDTGMDPTAAGMTPTRAPYNIGSSTLALNAGSLVLTIVNSYETYRVTSHAVAGTTAQDLVVQSVSTNGADGALVTAKLDPLACGRNLKTGPNREIDISFVVGAVTSAQNLTFGFDVLAVPASEYVPATCTASSW